MFTCEMLLLAHGAAHTHFILTAWMELHTAAAALGSKDIFSMLAALKKCH